MDLHTNNAYRRAVSPVSVSDNTPIVSQIIDRAGFEGLEFAIASGSLADADATFTVLVEHSDAANFAGSEAVADEFLIGTEAAASFAATDDDQVKKIGYIGIKRYVRLTITPASNASAALFAVIAHLSGARKSPVA